MLDQLLAPMLDPLMAPIVDTCCWQPLLAPVEAVMLWSISDVFSKPIVNKLVSVAPFTKKHLSSRPWINH